jgi:hypothetical protein
VRGFQLWLLHLAPKVEQTGTLAPGRLELQLIGPRAGDFDGDRQPRDLAVDREHRLDIAGAEQGHALLAASCKLRKQVRRRHREVVEHVADGGSLGRINRLGRLGRGRDRLANKVPETIPQCHRSPRRRHRRRSYHFTRLPRAARATSCAGPRLVPAPFCNRRHG